MRHARPREFYIPSNETVTEHRDTESDAVAFTYEAGGAPYALAFSGKRSKPDWHYRFQTVERRASKIAEHAESRRAHARYRAEQKAKRAAPHTLKVGDLLKTSWGYDQTNVEFFEVVALVGVSMVEVREIADERESTGWETGTATPTPGVYVGKPFRRRVVNGRWSHSIRIEGDYRIASQWDGKPAHWSSYA